MNAPQFFRSHLSDCWCDPDRMDLFNTECPTHGIPKSVFRWRNGVEIHR